VAQLGGGGGVFQVEESRGLAPGPQTPAIARRGHCRSRPVGGGGRIQLPDALLEQRLKTRFPQQGQPQGIRAPAAGEPAAGLGGNGNDVTHQGQGHRAAGLLGQWFRQAKLVQAPAASAAVARQRHHQTLHHAVASSAEEEGHRLLTGQKAAQPAIPGRSQENTAPEVPVVPG